MILRMIISTLLILLLADSSFGMQTNPESSGIKKTLDGYSYVSIKSGVSLPMGDFLDFADNGFNSEMMISRKVCKNCMLDMSLGYNSFRLNEEFIEGNTNDYSWELFSVALGPKFSLSTGRFSYDIYGNAGISFMNTPAVNNTFETTGIETTVLDNNSIRALAGTVGINLNVNLCQGLDLFLNTEYTGYLNSEVVYSTRDLNRAIDPTGQIDPDLLSSVPLESETLDLSHLNLNAGFRFSLDLFRSRKNNAAYGSQGGSSRAQDYNSSRSNNGSAGIVWIGDDDIVLVKRPDGIFDELTGASGGGNRAQDYNSSRSNNGSAGIALDLNENEDIILRKRPGIVGNQPNVTGVDAPDADEQVTRLNNMLTIYATLADGEDVILRKRPGRAINEESGGNGGGTRAQDYNSSRSNNSSVIVDWDGDDMVLRKKPGRILEDSTGAGDTGAGGGNRAQDYNSSRSNNGSAGIVYVGEDDIVLLERPDTQLEDESKNGDSGAGGGNRAQDYNSSRSNNGSAGVMWGNGEDIILRKRPLRAMNDGTGGANNTGGNRAQDYNSSRSNNSGIVLDFDNGEDIILRKRQGRIRTDGTDTNNETGGTRAQDYNSSRSNNSSSIAILVDLEKGILVVSIIR